MDLTPWKFCSNCGKMTLAEGPCQFCGTDDSSTKSTKKREGKWKYDDDCKCWVCSECGSSALNDYAGRSTPSDFCPKCGKPMILEVKEAEYG